MSYAVGKPKNKLADGMGQYSGLNQSSDLESGITDPLVVTNLKSGIRQQLEQVKTSVKKLETMCN